MSAITFFAAGLIAAAVAALANPRLRHPARPAHVAAGGSARLAPAPADDRGITLQTLIITAVVVLLAVAVGVVIIAVTDSSSDDLEETAPEVAGLCNEVEIYDPEVAARNEKGVQVAYTYFARPEVSNEHRDAQVDLVEFEGSDIGCVPVCLWVEPIFSIDPTVHGNKNRILQSGEVMFVRDLNQRNDLKINVERPLFVRGERRIYLLATGNSREEMSYFSKGANGELETQPIDDENIQLGSVKYMGEGSNAQVGNEVARVAVAANGKQCLTYDEYGNVLFHRNG